MNVQDCFDSFDAVLKASGAAAALAYLNGGVPHRYTAVYQLDGDRLRNVHLYDKAGEMRPEFLAEVPMATSFCQFVLRDGVFCTDDSAGDARLDGHPYQGVMVSYHGVPLLDDRSELWGTLCHFDTQPLVLSDAAFALLQRAARRLPAYL